MTSTADNFKVVLGDEFDEELRKQLGAVIKDLGGKVISDEYGIGGSQEFSEVIVAIGKERIAIESETYIGLSISGPESLVKKICERMHRGV